MSTEADKTNTAVIGTMLAIGAAAMIGGSAALVALARGEVQERGERTETFANLGSVGELKSTQRKRLTESKLPIDKAESQVLAEIRSDPTAASPKGAGLVPAASASADAGTPASPADPTQQEPPEETEEEAGHEHSNKALDATETSDNAPLAPVIPAPEPATPEQ